MNARTYMNAFNYYTACTELLYKPYHQNTRRREATRRIKSVRYMLLSSV